jgi:hypothetical protein
MTYLELKKMALMQLYNGSDFTYILHDGECLLLKYIGRKKIVFIPDPYKPLNGTFIIESNNRYNLIFFYDGEYINLVYSALSLVM